MSPWQYTIFIVYKIKCCVIDWHVFIGQTSVEDFENSGYLSSRYKDDNLEKVHQVIHMDQWHMINNVIRYLRQDVRRKQQDNWCTMVLLWQEQGVLCKNFYQSHKIRSWNKYKSIHWNPFNTTLISHIQRSNCYAMCCWWVTYFSTFIWHPVHAFHSFSVTLKVSRFSQPWSRMFGSQVTNTKTLPDHI